MYQPTEVERRMMEVANPDDLILIDGRIMRVIGETFTPGVMSLMVEQCAWFARCADDATHLTPHSIIGAVPTCAKHNAVAGYGPIRRALHNF